MNTADIQMGSRVSAKEVRTSNLGAMLFEQDFLSEAELAEAGALAQRLAAKKEAVHKDGRYSDIRWFQYDLDPNWSVARKILDELGADQPELLVFYYLEPGAKIHPHRDLSGASLNNRVRFHVPVITNPEVRFMVDNERIVMSPGELWCLDTSYVHSVANEGPHSRVHIVVECAVNDKLRKRIPNNLKTKLHTLSFFLIMAGALAKSIVVNSFKDPKYLLGQLGMIMRYIGWRFLRIGKPR